MTRNTMQTLSRLEGQLQCSQAEGQCFCDNRDRSSTWLSTRRALHDPENETRRAGAAACKL